MKLLLALGLSLRISSEPFSIGTVLVDSDDLGRLLCSLRIQQLPVANLSLAEDAQLFTSREVSLKTN